jgi:hypothetical protein
MLPDPDGPGRRKALESALGDDLAALGPAVSWPEAGTSLRRAAAAFRLAAQGRIGDFGAAPDDGEIGAGRGITPSGRAVPAGASPTGQGAASPRAQSSSRLIVAVEHLPALLLAA